MTETTAGLIQMTAHMVVRGSARSWMVLGAACAVLGLMLALGAALSRKKGRKARWVALFMGLALIGGGMLWAGAAQPRRKVIYCCASGPVSLEQVAARYDILEVDGAMIKIAER